jgi:putative glycosyltransferase (TIGR04372 family)
MSKFIKKKSLYKRIDNYILPVYGYPVTRRSAHKYFIENIQLILRLKQSEFPFRRIVKFIYMYVGAFFLLPVSFIFYIFNVKILLVDLTQIGSIHYLDLAIRENINNNIKYIVLSANNYPKANNYLISLYSKRVFLIKNIFFRLVLIPLSLISYICKNTFEFDGCSKNTKSKEIYNESLKKYPQSLVKLKIDRIDFCKKICILNNINYDKFVLLHVRDSGFNNESYNSLRNADISSYKDSIKYLIDKGYSVVRMGDNSASKIEKLGIDFEGFIDYAHSSFRSEEMDVYLFSHAKFYIGTPSGASFMSFVFLIPILVTNAFPADMCLGFSKNDLTIFKKLKLKVSKNLVSINQYFEDLSGFLTIDDMKYKGIFIEDNSSKEIKDAIIEMEKKYTKLSISPSEAQVKLKKLLSCKSFSYNSQANFSDSFIHSYETQTK